jgi:hypothetical protein
MSSYPASLKKLRTRARLARVGLDSAHCVTCASSRHLHIMAEALANPRTKGLRYSMLLEEPEHCAETMLAVLACLWEARQHLRWDEKKERWVPK